ncbi:RHS repeat domain-containing protein [Pseudomonas sp. LB3P14]
MKDNSPGSVHSNAFNFGEFVAGGVDPRTGLYTCSLSLGTVRSAGLNGPLFGLTLSFNPLNHVDAGYGVGWSLATTHYDLQSKTMTLSGGERYKALETVTGLEFKEMKLESVKVLKAGTGRYDVRYKDGRQEELEVFGASRIAVPTRIVSANGVSIALKYTLFNQYPMLTEVRDCERCLLKTNRTAGRVTLSQNPGTLSEAQFTLSLRNARVMAIGLPEGGNWNLEYEDIDGVGYLKRIVTPLGAVETIRYKKEGHLVATGDSVQALPHVIAHDIYPRHGQSKVSKTYKFSDRNFLGHGLEATPPDDGDPLYRAPANYQYFSVENLLVDHKVHTHTKRTYNKFHLLVAQVTTCGEAVTSITTDYHCSTDKSFREQPPQFRMPKMQTVCYENRKTKKTRKEITVTEFDGAGNLLKQVGSDGVTTLSEFYPATESPGCPADPLGFVRFVKQRTVTAASGDAASTITRYRYALQPALQNSEPPGVVPVEESFFEVTAKGEVLRSKTERTYLDTPGDPFKHGALQEQSITQNGKRTRSAFSYELDGTTLRLKNTVHGFDGTLRTTEQALSTLTGLKVAETNTGGGSVEYEYDKIGRRLRETLSPGKTCAVSTQWAYQVASASEPATMVLTDPSGSMQKTTYDGLGRVIGIQALDCDHPDELGRSQMRTLYAALHDKAAQQVEQTHTDWWDGVARPMKTVWVYDAWGQIKQTLHADGRIEHSEFDPVARQGASWQEGMGKTMTVLNDFGKPESVEVFSLKGQSLGRTRYEYDGLGRTISQTDPAGNTTRYHYDVFDRMVRSVLPDGSAVETEYAIHSAEALPVEVKVAGQRLGHQTFDGLSRLIESSVGGRTSETGYEAGLSQPKWHRTAGGEKTEFVYSQELGGRLAERKANGLLARFTYEAVNGKLKTCIEQGREACLDYYPSGRLKSETTHYGGHRQTTSYTYSLSGRPLTFVDGLGVEHKTEYDEWGRKISFKQGPLKAEFFYNESSSLERIETRDTTTRRLMITRLAYDDIGREITRSFEVEGLATQMLTSSYTLSGKLAQKVLKRGTELLRDEQFTYDERGRLSHYACEGAQRPRDPYGKEIVQQTFTFDALDNIVTLQTTFPQGANLTTFSYSTLDPTQLMEVRHSHADYPQPVTLEYDASGQMVKDDQARTLAYDALGRLTLVNNAQGAPIRGFHYDGFDRVVELSQPNMLDVQRYYHNETVISEVRGKDSRSIVRHDDLLLGQHQLGMDPQLRIFGTDQQQSVLTEFHGQQLRDSAYSPYGHRPAEGGFFSLAGFNGEQLDPLTGLYLLGNGYRAYSPTLMRFMRPDSMSPFGAGGLNAYAYCLGDPINRVDPTGHFSWQAVLGIALGVAGILASIATLGVGTLAVLGVGLGVASGLTGIASELANEWAPESEVGSILGWVSLGLGLASAGAGALAVGRAFNRSRQLYRPRLLAAADEQPARIVEKEDRIFGMGRQSKARGNAAQAEPPSNWTFTEDIGPHDYIENGKRGAAQRAKYNEYRNEIVEHNTHPREAAKVFPTALYENYPNYKHFKPNDVHKNFMHAHIRLTQEHRVFFLVNDDTRQILIKQIGSHDPRWV